MLDDIVQVNQSMRCLHWLVTYMSYLYVIITRIRVYRDTLLSASEYSLTDNDSYMVTVGVYYQHLTGIFYGPKTSRVLV